MKKSRRIKQWENRRWWRRVGSILLLEITPDMIPQRIWSFFLFSTLASPCNQPTCGIVIQSQIFPPLSSVVGEWVNLLVLLWRNLQSGWKTTGEHWLLINATDGLEMLYFSMFYCFFSSKMKTRLRLWIHQQSCPNLIFNMFSLKTGTSKVDIELFSWKLLILIK